MSSPVVLINVFSVPQGSEEQFIKFWTEALELMKNEPGFINAKLHRSLEKDTRFQFINVAHWESPEAWKNALSKPQFQAVGSQASFEENPALYRVELET